MTKDKATALKEWFWTHFLNPTKNTYIQHDKTKLSKIISPQIEYKCGIDIVTLSFGMKTLDIFSDKLVLTLFNITLQFCYRFFTFLFFPEMSEFDFSFLIFFVCNRLFQHTLP